MKDPLLLKEAFIKGMKYWSFTCHFMCIYFLRFQIHVASLLMQIFIICDKVLANFIYSNAST